MKQQNIWIVVWVLLLLRLAYLFANGTIPIPLSCHIQGQGKEFVLDANCLLQGKLPKLSFKEAVDVVWDEVKGFQDVYMSQQTSFLYSGTQPMFKNEYPSLLPVTKKEIVDMRQAAKEGKRISISLKQLAHYYISWFTFYVADKDISQLKPCTKQNYELALTSVDKLMLQPGQVFNYNNHLKDLQGYCDGISGDVRLFYGGVCGVSSQLFRAALIQPDVSILQRQAHNERFTVYYWEKAQGDDASVVEMRKQFEIKNASKSDLYFRTKKIGDITYLVIIAPGDSDRQVKISKTYISDLQVNLTRQILQTDRLARPYWPSKSSLNGTTKQTVIKQETFSSLYIGKNNESR